MHCGCFSVLRSLVLAWEVSKCIMGQFDGLSLQQHSKKRIVIPTGPWSCLSYNLFDALSQAIDDVV